MSKLLEVVDLQFRYASQSSVFALPAFSLATGQRTLLMGPSGCGKSTLAALVAGLYPEHGGEVLKGSVLVDGLPVADMPAHKRCQWVSMVFQNPDMQFCMRTLREELRFCLENLQVAPERMDDRIAQATADLGIEALLDRPFELLSGGEKQICSLCCLMLFDAKLWVLDEPCANVDPVSARKLVQVLARASAAREKGGRPLSMLVIDHRPDLWLDIVTDIAVMEPGGALVARDIVPGALHEYTQLFDRYGLWYPGRDVLQEPVQGKPHESLQSVPQEPTQNILREPSHNTLFESGLSLNDMVVELGDGRHVRAHVQFPKGVLSAITGPSGSGKTSFLKALLARYLEDKTGPRLGIVFQNPSDQFFCATVADELAVSLSTQVPAAQVDDTVHELLASFGLENYADQSPFVLSQGQQRRLAVLCVVAAEQDILLLDEPTYGQDAARTEAIMQLIANKAHQTGLTVILSTHDLSLVQRWCQVHATIAGGELRCVERGSSMLIQQ